MKLVNSFYELFFITLSIFVESRFYEKTLFFDLTQIIFLFFYIYANDHIFSVFYIGI